jgi:hypothetical protein
MNIDEKKAENTPAGGVLIGKKDGQTIIHDEGTMSGYLVGKLHKDGGIKAVNKATGQPLEMQGGEVVITAPAVADQTKREFEGKMMTNREILSTINEKGGGVSFANGGDIPAKIHTTDCEYKLGGKVVKDTDIAHSLGMNSTLKKGKQQFSSGDTTYDVDAIYNAIKKGKLRLKTKEVETFPMKYSVYDKNYAENHKIDFRKPNGITVRTESGEEVLIDGNHRMNNAYSKGRKTMKTYYIDDPKQIAKFTKKNKFMIGGYNAKTISDFENPKEAIEYVDKEIVSKAVGIYTGGKFKEGGHLSKGKSLKQIAEMHNVSLAHINEELAKGLEVEKEHFSDFKERTRVAKDHLVENPNYYTILEKAGLKRGGHIQKQELVENSIKGDTPARDLNNYNDILDLQADGVVGMESGLAFANGGSLEDYNFNFTVGKWGGFDIGDGEYFMEDFKSLVESKPQFFVKTEEFKDYFETTYIPNPFDVEDLEGATDEEYIEMFKFADTYLTSKLDIVNKLKNNNQIGIYNIVPSKKTGKIEIGDMAWYDLGLNGLGSVISHIPTKESPKYEELQQLYKENFSYANGGITPYDANLDGDSVDIVNAEFAKGGVVYDTTKPKIEKVTIKDTKYDRTSVVGRNASTVSELQQIVSDYIGNSPKENIDWISFYINDATRGSYYIDLNKGKKNTVKNVNPETLNSLNFRRVIDAKDYLVKNYDWTDFFELGSQTPNLATKVLNRADFEYIKIKLGGNKNLALKVVKKLEEIGFTDTQQINELLSDDGLPFSIFTLSNYVGTLDNEYFFNKDKNKEIFPSDLGIGVGATASTSAKPYELNAVVVKWKNKKEFYYTGKELIEALRNIERENNGQNVVYEVIGYDYTNKSISGGVPVEVETDDTSFVRKKYSDQDIKSKIDEWLDGFDTHKFFSVNQATASTTKKDEVKFIEVFYTLQNTSGVGSEKIYSPDKLVEFLRGLSNGDYKDVSLQPKGNRIIVSPKPYDVSDSVNKANLFDDDSAKANLMSDIAFVMFPDLNFFDFLNRNTTTSTSAQPFDFTDTKINVSNNPELSVKVQKKAFEDGWEWENGGEKTIDYSTFNYLYFTKTSISDGFKSSSFVNSPKREITESDIFGSQAPTSNKEKVMFLTAQNGSTQRDVKNLGELSDFISDFLANNSGVDFSNGAKLRINLYLNGDNSSAPYVISLGENVSCNTCLDVLTDGVQRIQEIILSYAGTEEFDWSDFFGEESKQTPTVSGSLGSVQEIEDLKEAVGVLEGIASQASQKYNTKKYDENLQLLKDVKEEYELALSFTPESSFMYERIELMKKITEIQKEITRITELKNGGAFYILSKVIDRLERGENWKELGNGEIMVNEVPQQEIDTVIYTEKFKNWFGDWEKALVTKEYDYVSKVLTESGKPCVMYHGAKRIKYSYRQVSNGVLYLAENRSYAEWFSANESPYQKQGDFLTQCFVNLKNPIDLTPFGVEEVDLRDIIQYIDALYPLAKIYDVLPPNVAMAIMNNQLIGRNFRAWYIIRQFPELNSHIRDNTTYDGFIYYENNPSDMIISESGEMVENVTKATAVFNSSQVKLVDAMLFDGSLDDWRFEKGGKVN